MTVAPSFCDEGSSAEARVSKKSGKSAAKSKNGKSAAKSKKGTSAAKSKKGKSAKKSRKGKAIANRSGKKKGKAKRRRRGSARGQNVSTSKLSKRTLTKPSGRLWVYTENLHEEVKVRAFDPRLYETLSRLQDHFDGKRIHLVSGFRFQRNEGSRHYHASAADIRIPGVSIRAIRSFVSTLDHGGMGIGLYPNSNFVHVDFRAPGQPSYRWVDRSRGGSGRGKGRSKRSKRRVPNT
jgi:uncharacterized protein YcbK (DUF882 family)